MSGLLGFDGLGGGAVLDHRAGCGGAVLAALVGVLEDGLGLGFGVITADQALVVEQLCPALDAFVVRCGDGMLVAHILIRSSACPLLVRLGDEQTAVRF